MYYLSYDFRTRRKSMSEVVGTFGTVTIPIRPPRPGEVRVSTTGGTQVLIAYADEEISSYASVVVLDVRPDGVDVGKAR